MKLCEAFPGPTIPEAPGHFQAALGPLRGGTWQSRRAAEECQSRERTLSSPPSPTNCSCSQQEPPACPAPEPALQAQYIPSSGQGRRAAAAAAAASLMPTSNKMLQHCSAPCSSRVHKHRPHSSFPFLTVKHFVGFVFGFLGVILVCLVGLLQSRSQSEAGGQENTPGPFHFTLVSSPSCHCHHKRPQGGDLGKSCSLSRALGTHSRCCRQGEPSSHSPAELLPKPPHGKAPSSPTHSCALVPSARNRDCLPQRQQDRKSVV